MPDRPVVVDGDRVRDASLLCGPSNVIDILLERKFRCVHADDDQPLFLVPRGPRANVGHCAKPIDAGVRPEVDENDLALKLRRRQWSGIEPGKVVLVDFWTYTCINWLRT